MDVLSIQGLLLRCTPRSFPDMDTLSRAAAECILRAAEEAVRARGRFALALSGGDTPRPLYGLMAADPWSTRIPWDRTHLFWSDERCVPPESGESNFHAARELLLSQVPIPENQIHRIPAEQGGEAAAARYQRELEDFFLSPGGKSGYFPDFDCLLLGMGVDGHFASLFPGTPALEENTRWVAPVDAPAGNSPRERVTLTLPVINRAKRLLFLVSGERKRETLRRAFGASDASLPVSRVEPRGECMFFTDFTV